MARYSYRDDRFGYGGFPEYVPVAQRKARAEKEIAALKKKGVNVSPVVIEGNTIASTFWGKAWCENLERYSDFANRLPRGRSYLRHGCVLDLQIERGRVLAQVQGSSNYTVKIGVTALAPAAWQSVVGECTGKVASVVELLGGKLSSAVMEVVTRSGGGLFPAPEQIRLDCSCPDGAYLCKHVAAVLYGVGARLDSRPELLFTLRHVDAAELVGVGVAGLVKEAPATARKLDGNLAAIFGVDLVPATAGAPVDRPAERSPARVSPFRRAQLSR